MSGHLKALRKVAELDSQILELNRKQKHIPELIQQKRDEVQQATEQLTDKETKLRNLRVKTELQEKEFQAAEQTAIKLREQINRAKSNKEFQALQHEILSREADNTRLEDAVLAQMQKLDQQAQEREALGEKEKRARTELASEQTRLEAELKRAKAEIERLRQQRADAGKDVPPDIFDKYERLIARRGQTAMVAVVNGSCQGCFMTLRAETIAQLKKRTDLVTCHSCGRILYLEE